MSRLSMEKQPLPDFIKEDEFFLTYPCSKMTVFTTKRPVHILKGEYSHRNYEFIITRTRVKDFVLDGVKMDVAPGKLFAINSDQLHGTRLLVSGVSFISIQFEREFLQELAYGIYGIRNAVFDNGPVDSGDEIIELVDKYSSEHSQREKGYLHMLGNLSVQIAIALFRKLKLACPAEKCENSEQSSNIAKVIEHFKQNYEEDFSLEEISDLSRTSKFNLIRKFKESTGMTPHEYFTNVRIMKALEHLNDSSNKIVDVAVMCGFENHSHFSRVFKSRTGLTPTDYRKRVLGI